MKMTHCTHFAWNSRHQYSGLASIKYAKILNETTISEPEMELQVAYS